MLELNIIDVAESTSDNNENKNIDPDIKDQMVDKILANNIPQYTYDLMCVHISSQLPKNVEGYNEDSDWEQQCLALPLSDCVKEKNKS